MSNNNLDWRVSITLTFPPESEGIARGILRHSLNQIDKAIVVNEGEINEERGYISLHQCGHRIDTPCLPIEKWEVGRGQVL